jgi:hypothetical protein
MRSDHQLSAPGGPGVEDGEQVFRREGEYWTIVFDGVTSRLRDARGLRHLAVLLAHPHEPVAALALARGRFDHHPPSDASPDLRERARINVTRAIKAALGRIKVHDPVLHRHLAATIRTGTFCSYIPDPRLLVRWKG